MRERERQGVGREKPEPEAIMTRQVCEIIALVSEGDIITCCTACQKE